MKAVRSDANAHLNAGSRLLSSVLAKREFTQEVEPNHETSAQFRRRNWEGDEVRVQLSEFLPIMLQAALHRSTWLDDFDNETLVISKDLHEVLSTYHRMQSKRRAA